MTSHMKAARAFYDRAEYPDGAVVGMSIWLVPESVAGSAHSFKHSLFYGYPGKRIVGYDKERGKGDHRHVKGRERPYKFSSVETLVSDFLSDVQHARGDS